MIDVGILHKYTRVELIRGHVMEKTATRSPLNSSVMGSIGSMLRKALPEEWHFRTQSNLVLVAAESHLEPDFSILRGNSHKYHLWYPDAGDCGLVVEVADETLPVDRELSMSLYAQAQIPEYWVVNLMEMQIESYTQPTVMMGQIRYEKRTDYSSESTIPLRLEGQEISQLSVGEVLLR